MERPGRSPAQCRHEGCGVIAAAADVAGAADAGASAFHQLHGYIPYPDESHRLFGAGFLILGALFVAEMLAGRVWHRNPLRTELWPATLVFLGWGLLVVTVVEPSDRPIHAGMGIVLLAAGLAERRYRHGRMSRTGADVLVVSALILGALEIGVLHSHGDMTSRGFVVHSVYGLTGAGIAAARLYQAGDVRSTGRSVLVGALVIVLALQLLGLSHGSIAPRIHELEVDFDDTASATSYYVPQVAPRLKHESMRAWGTQD